MVIPRPIVYSIDIICVFMIWGSTKLVDFDRLHVWLLIIDCWGMYICWECIGGVLS